MPPNPQRLELTWIGKEKRPQLEPRILLADEAQSYHAKKRVTKRDIFDNLDDGQVCLKIVDKTFFGG